MYRSASSKVKFLLSTKGKDEETKGSFDFATDSPMETIGNHIADLDDRDTEYWLACFLAAMDETEGGDVAS